MKALKLEIEEREKEICKNCKHFIQHYYKHEKANGRFADYIPVDAGHCTYPRVKDRKPSDTCKRFERFGSKTLPEGWRLL